MQPRLQLLRTCTRPTFLSALSATATTPIAPFLVPTLLRSSAFEHTRNASILSSIADNRSAYNKRIRRGRGPASGKGKTSGRGHKGQKQHGKVPVGFNGGQTKEEITSPTRGKGNKAFLFTSEFVTINVDRIQSWIDQKRLDPARPITLRELQRSRCTHGLKDGVKLLARNAEQLRTPINIIVSRASASAIQAVEAAGGTVTTRYYTRPAIKRIMAGETDPINSLQSLFPESIAGTTSGREWRYRLPDATSRADIEYYRDPAHRGYLSHMVKEDEGPSLYFKLPSKLAAEANKKKSDKKKVDAAQGQKLW